MAALQGFHVQANYVKQNMHTITFDIKAACSVVLDYVAVIPTDYSCGDLRNASIIGDRQRSFFIL